MVDGHRGGSANLQGTIRQTGDREDSDRRHQERGERRVRQDGTRSSPGPNGSLRGWWFCAVARHLAESPLSESYGEHPLLRCDVGAAAAPSSLEVTSASEPGSAV